MSSPSITMDLEAIRHNARAILEAGRRKGVDIVAVTKASHGDPVVGHAMMDAGARMLGESRLSNIRRLRRGGVNAPIMMLRLPAPTEAAEVVRLCDVSLNSEIKVLQRLNEEAAAAGRVHNVVVMLEMGDRREGVLLSEAPRLYDTIMHAPALRLAGIGANFMCATGVFPTIEKLQELSAEAARIEREYGTTLDIVSGGNSTSIPLLDENDFPVRVNQLRVGAALFLGAPMLNAPSSIDLRDDAFTLAGEIVEIQEKHSLPGGEIGPDAFGQKVTYEDRGMRLRGIVNLGRVDMLLVGITPRDTGVDIVTASSDHLILDLTSGKRYEVGDEVQFDVNYPALLQANLSPSIAKRILQDAPPSFDGVNLSADASIEARPEVTRLRQELREFGFTLETARTAAPHRLPMVVTEDAAASTVSLLHQTKAAGLVVLDASPDLALAVGCSNTGLVGLRRATPDQARILRAREVSIASIEDVDSLGMADALNRTLFEVQSHGRDFILAIDSSVAWRLPDDRSDEGLSFRELSTAMELIAASRGLRGVILSAFTGPDRNDLGAILRHIPGLIGRRVMDGIPSELPRL